MVTSLGGGEGGRGGGEGVRSTSYDGLYREALPERIPFSDSRCIKG